MLTSSSTLYHCELAEHLFSSTEAFHSDTLFEDMFVDLHLLSTEISRESHPSEQPPSACLKTADKLRINVIQQYGVVVCVEDPPG